MDNFICPVCRGALSDTGKTLVCENGHSYDKAKRGYVNLLGPSGKGHGDSREMVVARRDYLDAGYYNVLADKLAVTVSAVMPENGVLLDAGCGDCYYTRIIAEHMGAAGKEATYLGVDVSKDAVDYGARRMKQAELACASVYALPLRECSVDTVVCVFAPLAAQEFLRVLRPGGHLVMAIGATNHLWSLKRAVYDTPYKNEVADYCVEGFEFENKIPVSGEITLDNNADIRNLFLMTPYSHKTSAHDMAKLDNLTTLTTEIDFEVLVYKKPDKPS